MIIDESFFSEIEDKDVEQSESAIQPEKEPEERYTYHLTLQYHRFNTHENKEVDKLFKVIGIWLENNKYIDEYCFTKDKCYAELNDDIMFRIYFDMQNMNTCYDCYKFIDLLLCPAITFKIPQLEPFGTAPITNIKTGAKDKLEWGNMMDDVDIYDWHDWHHVGEIVYSFCKFIFGKDLSYGKFMKEVGKNELPWFGSHIFRKQNKEWSELEKNFTFIGHFDKIGNVSAPQSPRFNKMPWFGFALKKEPLVDRFETFSQPWSPTSKFPPKAKEQFTNTPVDVYFYLIPKNQQGYGFNFNGYALLFLFCDTRVTNGEEYCWALLNESGVSNVPLIDSLSCVMPYEQAKEIIPSEYEKNDEEDYEEYIDY